MQIDVVGVWKQKFEAAQRIPFACGLPQHVGTGPLQIPAPVDRGRVHLIALCVVDLEARAGQVSGIVQDLWEIFPFHHAGRHGPSRVQHQIVDGRAEGGRLRVRLAHHDPGAPDRLALFVVVQLVANNIHQHCGVGLVVHEPAGAFQVGANLLDVFF